MFKVIFNDSRKHFSFSCRLFSLCSGTKSGLLSGERFWTQAGQTGHCWAGFDLSALLFSVVTLVLYSFWAPLMSFQVQCK